MKADNEADRDAIAKLERELGTELGKAKPVDATVDRIFAEIGKHKSEMSARMQDAMLEFHAKLDAKQRAELAKMVSEHGLRGFMHGGGKHGKHGKLGGRGGHEKFGKGAGNRDGKPGKAGAARSKPAR